MTNNHAIYQHVISSLADSMSPCVPVSKRYNALYNHDCFHRGMICASVINTSISACASSIKKALHQSDSNTCKRNPAGEWFRDIISKIDIIDIHESFTHTIQQQITELSNLRCLPKKMDLAIDMHLIARYDKKRSKHLRRSKHKNGTTWFETYITIQCLNSGIRLVLAVVQVPASESHAEIVRKIIDSCNDLGISIGMVILDREFFSTRVMQTLDDQKVVFLIPCKNTSTVVKTLNNFDKDKCKKITKLHITDSATKDEFEYTLIITDRKNKNHNSENKEPKEKYIGFATNSSNTDVKKYALRWGIETGYRMIESARPKTRSNSMTSREFCFLYSILMFNAWVVANAIISCGSGGWSNIATTQTDMKIILMIKFLMQTKPPPDPPPYSL